jgi:hypothetical protein
VRVLAAAIYSILLTLPAIASSAPALAADAQRLTPTADATGGISGTVTAAAGGGKLFGVDVEVFDGSGNETGSDTTEVDGTYQVTGLAPAAAGYRVCFDARGVTGGSSSTGYRSQCYRGVPWWNYGEPAPGAMTVPVSAGRLTPAVDAALKTAGGISGTVTAAAGGAKLSNVNVEVLTSGDIQEATTGADGTYEVTGLDPAAPGYSVCIDSSAAIGGSSPLGYASQCYRNVPWAAAGPEPAPGAKLVRVTAGRLTPAVDAALGPAGGISGTVTADPGGARLSNVEVDVYGDAPDPEWSATTGPDGTYEVTGLNPAATGFGVCFEATDMTGGRPGTLYFGQCYRGVPWDGESLPSGATTVRVKAGKLTLQVDVAMEAAGGCSSARGKKRCCAARGSGSARR